MSSSLISNLRRQGAQLYEQYEAIFCILNYVDATVRRQFDAEKERIRSTSRPKLLQARERLKQEIKKLRREHGAKKPPQFYVRWLKEVRNDIGKYAGPEIPFSLTPRTAFL